MADRGIIFSTPMVLAPLADRKTQTRRLAKPQGGTRWWQENTPSGKAAWFTDVRHKFGIQSMLHNGYFVGQHLYVRENLRATELMESGRDGIRYEADGSWKPIDNLPSAGIAWLKLFSYGKKTAEENGLHFEKRGPIVPAIHCPRWASRLTLVVTAVAVHRLQDISREDCVAEGHPRAEADYPEEVHLDAARDWYMDLWDSLHTKPGDRWKDNPFVVAVSFSVHRLNIDRMPI